MADQDNILIIGASAAGISAAKEIRTIDRSVRITVITDEPHPPYYRPLLIRRLADESIERNPAFFLNKPEWYQENGIDLILGERVNQILPGEQKATTVAGRELSWKKLILAGGACPFIPIPGALNHENVFAIRTLDDARAAFRCQQSAERITVIGAGLLGLETADVFRTAGKQVCIVELNDRVLPVQLDREGSELFRTILTRNNCPLFLGDIVESLAGEDRITAVRLRSGREIPTDMALFSIGVRPNLALAQGCGLRTNRGILVNERMETSIPGIFACGDIAEFRDNLCLWMLAIRQGAVAGRNSAGRDALFGDEDYPVSMTSFGTRIFSIGDIGRKAPIEAYTQEERVDAVQGVYKKLYFRGERLVGGILIGDTRAMQELSRSVRAGASREEAEKLLGE